VPSAVRSGALGHLRATCARFASGRSPGAEDLAWTAAPERGSVRLARFMVWLVRRVGWWPGHLLLYPIAAYFLAFSPRQRAAARTYLDRALGRRAGPRDLFRLYFAFASTILDRAFLVAGEAGRYRIEVHGLDALRERIAEGRGCLLLGAHLGSFEALRAVADAGCPVEVAVMMHEANAARLKAVFDALGGPDRAAAVIPLGTADAMLRARECLERGGLVGLLADRAPRGERTLSAPFLGRPAPMPTGPHVLAAVLGAPVMLAFGLWRGPRRYEVRFEPFAEAPPPPGGRGAEREAAVAERVRRYAARLEALCRAHPYNWFNFFYDFWRGNGR
jgi:predicted LPLAT superfamily acyltransferase